jgi:hypothetical protein
MLRLAQHLRRRSEGRRAGRPLEVTLPTDVLGLLLQPWIESVS